MNKYELKARGAKIKPTIQIGKTGITDSIRDELRAQLDRKELIKIKALRSMGPSSSWKEDVEELIASVKAELIEIKGGTVLVYKRSNIPKKGHSKPSSK